MPVYRIVIAILALCVSACATSTPTASPPRGLGSLPGGYSQISTREPGVLAAAAFALEAQREAMRAAGELDTLELVSLQEALQQVVAGMNYRIEMTVSRGGKPQAVTAEVWWQAWRKPDPYRLTAWTWH